VDWMHVAQDKDLVIGSSEDGIEHSGFHKRRGISRLAE